MRRMLLIIVPLLGLVVLAGAWSKLLPGAERQATDEALDQAARIARDNDIFASSYSGEDLPSNAAVANHLARGQGVRSVLTTAVHDADERGVGNLVTVDVVLAGMGAEFGIPPVPAQEFLVCVRFTVVRAESGPRQTHYESRGCPPRVAS